MDTKLNAKQHSAATLENAVLGVGVKYRVVSLGSRNTGAVHISHVHILEG